MSSGKGLIYSKIKRSDLFNLINYNFNNNNINIEFPGTRKIQIWDNEGENHLIEKNEIEKWVIDKKDIVLQFWFKKCEDLSLSFINEDNFSIVHYNLDGLNLEQQKKLLILNLNIMMTNINKFYGFIFDRQDILDDINWNTVFLNPKKSVPELLNEYDLKMKKEYLLKNISDINTIRDMNFENEEIYLSFFDNIQKGIVFYIIE